MIDDRKLEAERGYRVRLTVERTRARRRSDCAVDWQLLDPEPTVVPDRRQGTRLDERA